MTVQPDTNTLAGIVKQGMNTEDGHRRAVDALAALVARCEEATEERDKMHSRLVDLDYDRGNIEGQREEWRARAERAERQLREADETIRPLVDLVYDEVTKLAENEVGRLVARCERAERQLREADETIRPLVDPYNWHGKCEGHGAVFYVGSDAATEKILESLTELSAALAASGPDTPEGTE